MDFFYNLKKPVNVLAPMVGNSGLAYRKLARKYGADLCYTEMVHCKQFLLSKSNGYKNKWYESEIMNNTENNVNMENNIDGIKYNYPKDYPLVVQICGNDPDVMLEAAKKIQGYCNAIDINFGCPQNIAKRGFYGSYLQNDLQLTSNIIKTLSNSLDVPVFCKIRIFPSLNDTLSYTKLIEDSGCSLMAVHGRTRDQRGINTGLANWNYIREIKNLAKIPVIANGNIIHKNDLKNIIDYTKCDGVMVAETHLHNPLIFNNTSSSTGISNNQHETCFDILFEYLDLCRVIDTKGSEIKSHIFKMLHKVLNDDEKQALEKTHGLENYISLLKTIEKNKNSCNVDFNLEARVRASIKEN